MKRYSAERKASVIQKMMPPHNTPISGLVAETGISDVTLYTWRKQARVVGIAVPVDGKNSEKWSSEDKFAIVLEDAALNEAELAEYCRQKGPYVEQIAAWRKTCSQANAPNSAAQAKAQREQTPARLRPYWNIVSGCTGQPVRVTRTDGLATLGTGAYLRRSG